MVTKSSLQKNLVYTALLILLSRVLGLYQDQLLIHFFAGATAASDAFLTAFRIPNMLRNIFSEGLLTAALIPVIVQFLQTNQRDRALRLLTFFFFITIFIFSLLWVYVWYFPASIIKLFAPGLDTLRLNYATYFLPAMFGFVFFLASSEILSAGLRSINHFFIPALGPSLYTATIIIALLLAKKFSWQSYTLAWMVTLGGFVKFLARYSAFRYFSLSLLAPKFINTLADAKIVFLRTMPLLGGFGVTQTHIIVEGIVGSYLAIGEISILHCAWRLINVPQIMLRHTVNLVLLPYLSAFLLHSKLRMRFMFFEVIKLLVWLSMPLSLQFFLSAKNLSAIFYGSTATALVIAKSAIVLQVLSLGIVFHLLNQALTTTFYACKDTLSPSLINSCATLINASGSFLGLRLFGLPGIPLATVFSIIITAPVLLIVLWQKHNIYIPIAKLMKFCAASFLQILLFLFLKIFLQYFFLTTTNWWLLGCYPFIFLTKRWFGIRFFLL